MFSDGTTSDVDSSALDQTKWTKMLIPPNSRIGVVVINYDADNSIVVGLAFLNHNYDALLVAGQTDVDHKQFKRLEI